MYFILSSNADASVLLCLLVCGAAGSETSIQPPEALLRSLMNLIPSWLSKQMHQNVWHESIHPFPNSNSQSIDEYEWIHDSIRHLTVCDYLSTLGCALTKIVKGPPVL